jgi:hypothetical protein
MHSPGQDKSPVKEAKSSLRYDQLALNFTQSQAATTYAGTTSAALSQASTHDNYATSGASVYSYDSQRDAGKFVKEQEGRVSDWSL